MIRITIVLLFCTTLTGRIYSQLSRDTEAYIAKIQKKEAESIARSYDGFGKIVGKIEFNQRAKSAGKKDWPDGIIPFVDLNLNLSRLMDGEAIVLKYQKFQLLIDYPLDHPATFQIIVNKNGLKRKELLKIIVEKYIQVYQEEEKTTKSKTIPVDKRKEIANRNQTDGKYGIWGHDLSDIVLSTVYIFQSSKGEITIVLGLQS